MDVLAENGPWAFAAWSLMLLVIGFALGFGRGRARSRDDETRGRLDRLPPTMPLAPPDRPRAPPTPSSEALTRIDAALRAGNKIHAIKLMREETGMGLAEAKQAVEARER